MCFRRKRWETGSISRGGVGFTVFTLFETFFRFFFLEGVTLENGSKWPIFGRRAGGHGHGPGGEKASIPVGKVGNQAGNSVSG